MSKVSCEAVGKRRQASLRMARAELLNVILSNHKKRLTDIYMGDIITENVAEDSRCRKA